MRILRCSAWRRTPGADVIKAAYRKKAAQSHPDRNPSPDAAARFREVQEAWEVLYDSGRRTDYDDNRRQKPASRSARDGAGRFRGNFWSACCVMRKYEFFNALSSMYEAEMDDLLERQ